MDTTLIAIIVGTNLIAIIGATAALAGLILRQGARLDRRIDTLQAQINSLQEQMNRRFNALQEQVTELRERMARVEGIITGRTASEEQRMRAQAGA